MADILSQILQGGLMNYSQPNALNQGLMSGDPSMQLGMQLLANSNTPGNFAGILGRSMLGTQEAQQKNAMSQLGLLQQGIGAQQAAQMWPLIMQKMQQMSGQGDPNAQAPQGQPQGQGASPTQGAPQGGGMSGNGMADLGAMFAMAGRPGGQQLLDYAKFQADNDPAHATQMAAAKSEIAQDQATLAQALKTGQMPLAQAAYTKFLKDAGMLNVGQFNGDVTTFGGITPQQLGMSNFNPQTGKQTVDGVQTPIPGAVGTTQALAAGKALGEAAGQVEPLQREDGTTVPASRLSVLTGGGSAKGGAPKGGASAPGQGPVMKIGPGQEAIIKSNASQAAKENDSYQSQMEAGKDMLTNTGELRRAAADFGSGRFAESRAKVLDWLNSANLLTPEQKNQLGSAQAGQKIAIQLQAAATKQLGSREAAQIFNIMGKSLPNLTLSADGLEKVSGYMDGIARYNIARGQVAQRRMSANDIQGVNNVRSEFVANSNPLYFIIASTAPAQRAEIIKSMGDKAPAFLASWQQAAKAGYAPRPNEYANSGS